MKFLSKSTKITCIVASALTAVATIALIMLSTLLNISLENKLIMTLIYTISLTLILLIWIGVVQIKVFKDYRCKRSYLCADGILTFCITALLIISGILLSILQLDKISSGLFLGASDIRIFLTIFLAILSIWKICITCKNITDHHFNSWCDATISILWTVLTIVCFSTMFITGQVLLWTIIGISWLLILSNIFYILYSYVIKEPIYLETSEAIEELQQELEEEQVKKEKNQKITNSFRLQEKLRKLKELRDNNLITEEEYNRKKNQLLETL